ncbi:bone morphogenetic protein 3 isoform X1 [Hemiscyllium ocellatum]|uniref:bone morphogenetic protein 3 isoform X1 n=1 Tax=Hemiscyllium ocellatum TaxID=170820 RepID=UPI00296657D7|nr:bone morphogenetic protein 3 isoform X1 [Hemiscyllium ocellatum]
MGKFHTLVFVCVGWSCLTAGFSDLLKDHFRGLRRIPVLGENSGDSLKGSPGSTEADLSQDTLSEHMLLLYDKYNKAGYRFKDGNTVRSYKAKLERIGDKQLHTFNLTSLSKSEDILSATLHYYIADLAKNTSNICPSSKGCSRHLRRKQINIDLAIWVFATANNITRTLSHHVLNASTFYRDFLSWQWKDITSVINHLKSNDDLLIGIEIMPSAPTFWKQLFSKHSPYILVYAIDSAISELDTVVSTLQRRRGSFISKVQGVGINTANRTSEVRRKRSANLLLPLHNNELPGAEYQYNEATAWETRRPYKKLHPRPADRERKSKQRKGNRQKSQTLQYDEQTLRKARRRQWNEPRNCARRYLKVDFADIGWSEWIISPKSFDAYYCAGACQFPMLKSLRPSNHATIQSIVRAVGVVPGIPEPCCVPEKMSSLSILFVDENKNIVLKVYPNMKVESCACR